MSGPLHIGMMDTGFTPTRAAGLERLAAFAPQTGRAYAAGRNTDHGPGSRQAVSMLSRYVRHRLVTETEVIAATLGHHSPPAARKFIQEVFWRSYFKGHLETRPAIWERYVARRDEFLADAGSGGLGKAYQAAIGGRTGIDCFDAWVAELVETGYLHNHTRMWFASIWIFTLKLPWELGADFTYRHFIDGDPASNTLSWRWVGGLHTRGKTYLARPDNIAEHTGGRFMPEGLARQAVALTEEDMPSSRPLPPALSTAPEGRIGLLLTEEDLNPESMDWGKAGIAVVAGATAVARRSPAPIPAHVTAFTDAALDDALARGASHFGAASERLAALDGPSLVACAERHGITAWATPYAPVGPAASALRDIDAGMAQAGLTLHQLRRPLDELAWPRSTRGFFALKEHIPTLLRKLGLAGAEDGEGESQMTLDLKPVAGRKK